MGKLLCDGTTVTNPAPPPIITFLDLPPTTTTTNVDLTSSTPWDDVSNLEPHQIKTLSKLHTKGILWKHPLDQTHTPLTFRLTHGGEVNADGNCLFTATQRSLLGERKGEEEERENAREMRKVTVKRFENDFKKGEKEERESVEMVIKNMYKPDVNKGWGVHVVQEVKLIARKLDRLVFDEAILELVHLGMQRELAAESIYKERCIAVEDGPSWAKYMSISGSPEDEYDIITLQYTEEGLLSVDENREGHAAAFGDDIAIECLATEFQREIYVVQAHGSDAMVDEDHCVFFLPHRPRCQITRPPIFLFMKGTGWCGAGADHYEPLYAHPCALLSQEKVAFVL